MLTPTKSRSETTRGAPAPGVTGLAVLGAAPGFAVVGAAGALDAGTAVVAGVAVVGGDNVVVGADVVDTLPLSARPAPMTARGESSARDPGANSSKIHAIPATIDPSRTAYAEFNVIYCESAAVRATA
ncbi:MAG: hypothetical protein ABI658_08400 [Acidimicrobiales bacterium]